MTFYNNARIKRLNPPPQKKQQQQTNKKQKNNATDLQWQ